MAVGPNTPLVSKAAKLAAARISDVRFGEAFMTTAASLLPSAAAPDDVPRGDAPISPYPRPQASGLDGAAEGSEAKGLRAWLERASGAAEPWFAFGPFCLCPRRRLLLEKDKPLRLGSRALDILIALVERPGEVVGKQELIARVWSGTVVEDGNLKVHVAALRRTLRGGEAGNRYICTVTGRGYAFVAPVTRLDNRMSIAAPDRERAPPDSPVPRVVGRNAVGALMPQLLQRQFVTVVGAGDMANGILFWELRAAASLVQLLRDQGWPADALALLRPSTIASPRAVTPPISKLPG
jgi:DNA-binding winged helix-turn-helix (wHTH) protein